MHGGKVLVDANVRLCNRTATMSQVINCSDMTKPHYLDFVPLTKRIILSYPVPDFTKQISFTYISSSSLYKQKELALLKTKP